MARPSRPMRLDCPRDRTPLVEREHEIPGRNVFADHCPKCEGVFLDRNELGRLTGQKHVNAQVTKHLGVDVGSTLVCPHDGGLMDDEVFDHVTIEVCTTCQGVWLDKGELEAIAALDDTKFKELSTAKQAEAYDAKLAARRARLGGLGLFSRRR